jgi:hypothetical protein
MRDSASEFCQRPAMRLGFVLRGADAGVAVGQLGGAAVAVVDGDDPLDVVQLGGDREKIRTSEAIRPSECRFSTLHCLRPLLKKRGNLSRPSVSYFTHARSARLYGLTDSIVAPGRMPVDKCGATGGRPRYKLSGAFERWAAIDGRLRLPFAHGVPLPDPFKKAGLARKPPEPARSGFSGLLSCFEQLRTILSGTATVGQTRHWAVFRQRGRAVRAAMAQWPADSSSGADGRPGRGHPEAWIEGGARPMNTSIISGPASRASLRHS